MYNFFDWENHKAALIVSFIYASVLMMLPIDIFKDRFFYLIYAENASFFVEHYLDIGVTSFLTNEPLFLFLNIFLNIFFGPENIIRVLIFVPAFSMAYSILQLEKTSLFHLLLFTMILLTPQVLKNFIMQLRQGLAVGLFVYAYYVTSKKVQFLLIFITPLIHASFFIVVVLFILSKSLFFLSLPRFYKIFTGVGIGLFLTSVILPFAVLLESRQGLRYSATELNVSGLAFIFWAVILILFLMQNKDWLISNAFSVINLTVYLTLYFLFPLSGRIFESVLPVIFISGFHLKDRSRHIYLGLFVFYFVYQYYLGLNKPLLGFAIGT